MGRVTTGVYKGVHEDGEPLRNAAQASAVVFKTDSERSLTRLCLKMPRSLEPDGLPGR